MPELVAAKPREGKFNKNAARRVRAAGNIPAVVYGAGQASVAVEVSPKAILQILHSESGHNTLFDIDIAGQGIAKVMIVDWQYEPIRDTLLHIDLKRIALDKAMKVSVPIRLIGVPAGVKNEGGMLDQVLREVEIECLPTEIPSHIDVDVTGLAMHGVIRVSDLPHGSVSDHFKFLSAEDATVAHVVSIRAEAEPTPDATAVAAATTAEPEVAKKGKTDAPAAEAKK
jgi:large subunit ribosomal protein L25